MNLHIFKKIHKSKPIKDIIEKIFFFIRKAKMADKKQQQIGTKVVYYIKIF